MRGGYDDLVEILLERKADISAVDDVSQIQKRREKKRREEKRREEKRREERRRGNTERESKRARVRERG